MKLFFLIFVLSSIFPKYVYSSKGDCEGAIATLISESANLITDVRNNLRSSNFQNRLQGLEQIKDIDPDGENIIYLEITPLIRDPHPAVRIAAVQVLQRQDFQGVAYLKIMYLLHLQLQREQNDDVSKAVDKAIDTMQMRYSEQMSHIGEKIKKHIHALNFSVGKAEHLVAQLGLKEQWSEITERALKTKPEEQTIMEQVALEIYKEVMMIENDFKDMIRTLPFETSDEFFRFARYYHAMTGNPLIVRRQTAMIIKKVYSLILN